LIENKPIENQPIENDAKMAGYMPDGQAGIQLTKREVLVQI